MKKPHPFWKMFNKKAFLSLLLCLALCLCSCGLIVVNDRTGEGEETKDGPDVTLPEETDGSGPGEGTADKSRILFNKAIEALGAVSVPDLAGLHFVIAGTDSVFFDGDGSENLLNADRIARNKALGEKFNATLTFRSYTPEELRREVEAAYKSGGFFADVLALEAEDIGLFATEGLLENLRSIKGFDLEAEYFDQGSVKALSAGHEVWGVSGDGCFDGDKMYAMFMNKTLAGDMADRIYTAVSEGKWTLDMYNACVLEAEAEEINPLAYSGKLPSHALLMSTGYKYLITDIDTTPVPNTYGGKLYELAEKIFPVVRAAAEYDGDMSMTLFMTGPLSVYKELYTGNVGILPCPKLDTDSEYITYSPDETVLCIPKDSVSCDVGAKFITCFNMASKDYIVYDYLYTSVLDTVRDRGSVESLKIITSGVNWDFATMISSGYRTLYTNTLVAFEKMQRGEISSDAYEEGREAFEEYLLKWFPALYD